MDEMKLTSQFTAMMLLIPAIAFAAQKNSASLKLDQPVTVAGTQLAPGQYKLVWNGSDSDMNVSFTQGNKTLATAHGTLGSNPTNEEAIETVTAADNTTVLQAVDFKNISIHFDNAARSAGN
jgi:hypothetical protein